MVDPLADAIPAEGQELHLCCRQRAGVFYVTTSVYVSGRPTVERIGAVGIGQHPTFPEALRLALEASRG